MAQINSREVVLLNAASATTSGAGNDIVLPAGVWAAATITLANSSNTGTTQTLDVKLQRKLGQAATADLVGNFPTGTAIYDDLLAFAQVTTTTVTKCANLVTLPMVPTANTSVYTSADYVPLDGTLTASNARVAPIGSTWRIKYVMSGTNPVFTFSVVAQLIPFGS